MDLISDEELKSINRALLIRFGIDFSNYESKSFKRRIARIIDKFGLESVYNLWHKILKDPDFLTIYIDELTVGLTELFRNPELWVGLRTRFINDLTNKERISIWHAGCSTGEEVYTTAILLNEANLLHKVTGLSTDLNTQSVAKAQNGAYDLDLLIPYRKNYNIYNPLGNFESYIDRNESAFVFKRDLVKNMDFRVHNLTRDSMVRKFDIIFCRNVMIYFDDVLKLRVLELFHHSLNPNGYLIIGFYDALPGDNRRLFEIIDPGAKIFRKID